jgi:hypothetical protein
MIERRFRNSDGEGWTLHVDRQRMLGRLSGTELGHETVQIANGQLTVDLILSQDEFDKIAAIWLEETGQTLQPPPFLLALELAAALA